MAEISKSIRQHSNNNQVPIHQGVEDIMVEMDMAVVHRIRATGVNKDEEVQLSISLIMIVNISYQRNKLKKLKKIS